jgi:hypothetical protein
MTQAVAITGIRTCMIAGSLSFLGEAVAPLPPLSTIHALPEAQLTAPGAESAGAREAEACHKPALPYSRDPSRQTSYVRRWSGGVLRVLGMMTAWPSKTPPPPSALPLAA